MEKCVRQESFKPAVQERMSDEIRHIVFCCFTVAIKFCYRTSDESVQRGLDVDLRADVFQRVRR